MKKKCTKCGEWKDRATQFYTAGQYKNGRPKWSSWCKPCDRENKRNRYHKGHDSKWPHKKAYSRARTRALTRLSKLVPELYDMCLREELAKEGVEVESVNGSRSGRHDRVGNL